MTDIVALSVLRRTLTIAVSYDVAADDVNQRPKQRRALSQPFLSVAPQRFVVLPCNGKCQRDCSSANRTSVDGIDDIARERQLFNRRMGHATVRISRGPIQRERCKYLRSHKEFHDICVTLPARCLKRGQTRLRARDTDLFGIIQATKRVTYHQIRLAVGEHANDFCAVANRRQVKCSTPAVLRQAQHMKSINIARREATPRTL